LDTKNKNSTKSKYFASTKTGDDSEGESSEEEKKEDENDRHGLRNRGRNAATATANRKRRILDDDDTVDNNDDEGMWRNKIAKPTAKASTTLLNLLDDDNNNGNDNYSDDDFLSHAHKKKSILSQSKSKTSSTFDEDEYVDDDEARAIEAAMKASLADQEGNDDECKQLFKRLKKKSKTSSRGMKNDGGSLGKVSSSSSMSLPSKKGSSDVIYKDDIPGYNSANDDDHVEQHEDEDDEIEVCDTVDEEEQTAEKVLAEANALSAKIVQIVSGWCGIGRENDGDGIKNGFGKRGMNGLLLAEDGALNLGSCGGVGSSANGNTDSEASWISKDMMKAIMPNVDLAEYQLLGVNWMALLNRTMFGGNGRAGKKSKNVNGILADEMGLGKTVQTIAFLAWLNHQKINMDEGPQRPHLIVVPASVLSNWMVEFKKFAPHMVAVKYHGTQAERDEIREEMDRKFVRGIDRLDIVLTTFSYFSSDSNRGDR
jgi:hypothetical protein